MSGAVTANLQDILGALPWNPGAVANLESTSLAVTMQALFPKGDFASSVDAGAFGPGFPQADLSGSTASEAGPFTIPALGFVYVRPESRSGAHGRYRLSASRPSS